MVHENTAAMSIPGEMTPLRDNREPLMPSRSLAGFPEPPLYSGIYEEGCLYFHIDPKHTNYVNRILEGYEYVGVMTSVDKSGRCVVRCTPDTRSLAIEILSHLSEVTLEI